MVYGVTLLIARRVVAGIVRVTSMSEAISLSGSMILYERYTAVATSVRLYLTVNLSDWLRGVTSRFARSNIERFDGSSQLGVLSTGYRQYVVLVAC